ncbi:MAG: class I SAM-dependent methyltransferase [Pseudomonadota bacterium]|nr:class I SAM-dependent methyltransferase [Pseudomonadota bacterium]
MSNGIIGLQDWFGAPPGRYLLDWEHRQFEQAVADIFGYHALQLGLPALDALQANRMPHRWLAMGEPMQARPASPGQRPLALMTDYAALPFPAASLDLVALPHALDSHSDPHATLREVARVLVPEGRVVISGFNPASLWGLRRQRDRLCRRLGWGEPFLPELPQLIGYRRLRDWLHLLDFEIEDGHFGCYLPAVRAEKWQRRLEGVDRLGARWWPIFGAVYFLVAVKRVHGVRLLGASWKTVPSRASATVPMANRSSDNHVITMNGKTD